MVFTLNVSKDGRIRTQAYLKDGAMMFCIAEPTAKGVLITEFYTDCQVANQIVKDEKDPLPVLKEYIGIAEFEVAGEGDYKGVRIEANCSKCGKVGLARQLDDSVPSKISEVPVIPIFVCEACKQRHYSLTRRYLSVLVSSNSSLFEPNELREIKSNAEASVTELNEYIIRIFASKKISKIELR